jgi:hypothetical protein
MIRMDTVQHASRHAHTVPGALKICRVICLTWLTAFTV